MQKCHWMGNKITQRKFQPDRDNSRARLGTEQHARKQGERIECAKKARALHAHTKSNAKRWSTCEQQKKCANCSGIQWKNKITVEFLIKYKLLLRGPSQANGNWKARESETVTTDIKILWQFRWGWRDRQSFNCVLFQNQWLFDHFGWKAIFDRNKIRRPSLPPTPISPNKNTMYVVVRWFAPSIPFALAKTDVNFNEWINWSSFWIPRRMTMTREKEEMYTNTPLVKRNERNTCHDKWKSLDSLSWKKWREKLTSQPNPIKAGNMNDKRKFNDSKEGRNSVSPADKQSFCWGFLIRMH